MKKIVTLVVFWYFCSNFAYAEKNIDFLIFFDKNQSRLKSREFFSINEFFKKTKKMKIKKIYIQGHTDAQGEDITNEKLSRLRAYMVSIELEKLGIPRYKMILSGLGAKEPMCSNQGEEGRSGNRRVEIIIIEQESAADVVDLETENGINENFCGSDGLAKKENEEFNKFSQFSGVQLLEGARQFLIDDDELYLQKEDSNNHIEEKLDSSQLVTESKIEDSQVIGDSTIIVETSAGLIIPFSPFVNKYLYGYSGAFQIGLYYDMKPWIVGISGAFLGSFNTVTFNSQDQSQTLVGGSLLSEYGYTWKIYNFKLITAIHIGWQHMQRKIDDEGQLEQGSFLVAGPSIFFNWNINEGSPWAIHGLIRGSFLGFEIDNQQKFAFQSAYLLGLLYKFE